MIHRGHRLASLIVLVALAGSLLALPAAAQKPLIAVIEFDFDATNQWWGWWRHQGGADAVQEKFTTELVKSGRFTVLERQKLQQILAEQDLQHSGAVDTSTAVRLGKLLGVKYMLTGAITKYGTHSVGASTGEIRRLPVGFKKNTFAAEVTARLVDVETGAIVWADDAEGTHKSGRVRLRSTSVGSDSNAPFDKLLEPIIEELVQGIKAADL